MREYRTRLISDLVSGKVDAREQMTEETEGDTINCNFDAVASEEIEEAGALK